MKKTLQLILSFGIVLAIVLSGCSPAATEAPVPAATDAPAEAATDAPAEAATEAPAAAATDAPAQPTIPPTPEPVEGGITRGGTLTWARGAIPENLDMIWSEANQDVWVMVNVIEELVFINDTGDGLEPGLAESWDISEDGRVYDFNLREGVKFNNGADLTADDVVFSLERARTDGTYTWVLENVESVEKVDDMTVRVTLIEPSPSLLATMALISVGIYNQAAFEELGVDEFMKDPVTTGPFMVKEWRVGESFVMEPNPYYWQMGEDGEPLPYLDEVVLTQTPEDTTKVLQVQSGTVLATDTIPFAMINSLQSEQNATVTLWPATQSYYIFINHTKPPFDDVKIRQALNYAVNREALVQVATSGVASPAQSFFSPGSLCWTGDYGFEYDPDMAEQLISESKYADGEIPTIEISIPAGRLIGIDIATTLQDMWGAVGFTVETQELEGALVSESFREETFQAISGYQWTDDILDPEQQTNFFMVEPALHAGYSSDEVNELVDQARLELDPEARCEIYHELQRIFNEDSIGIILFNNPFTTFISNDVNNFYQIPLGWLKFGKVWISQ